MTGVRFSAAERTTTLPVLVLKKSLERLWGLFVLPCDGDNSFWFEVFRYEVHQQ